jgi:hypothetical protein
MAQFLSIWGHNSRSSAPYAYLEDTGRKDQERALLNEGSTPMMLDKDVPDVTDATAPTLGMGNGTYKTLRN